MPSAPAKCAVELLTVTNTSIFFRILSSRQLEVTEDGQLISKEKVETVNAREALRKQHKRSNKMRKAISLEEFMDTTGGGSG